MLLCISYWVSSPRTAPPPRKLQCRPTAPVKGMGSGPKPRRALQGPLSVQGPPGRRSDHQRLLWLDETTVSRIPKWFGIASSTSVWQGKFYVEFPFRLSRGPRGRGRCFHLLDSGRWTSLLAFIERALGVIPWSPRRASVTVGMVTQVWVS